MLSIISGMLAAPMGEEHQEQSAEACTACFRKPSHSLVSGA